MSSNQPRGPPRGGAGRLRPHDTGAGAGNPSAGSGFAAGWFRARVSARRPMRGGGRQAIRFGRTPPKPCHGARVQRVKRLLDRLAASTVDTDATSARGMKDTNCELLRVLAIMAVPPFGVSMTLTASHAGGGGGFGGGAGGGGSYGLGGTAAGGGPIGAGCCEAAVAAARRVAASAGSGAERSPDARLPANTFGRSAGHLLVRVPRTCTRLRRLVGRCRRYQR